MDKAKVALEIYARMVQAYLQNPNSMKTTSPERQLMAEVAFNYAEDFLAVAERKGAI